MEIRCADHVTPLYPQKLALTSPTGGGRSVGIVRSRTKATEFSFCFSCMLLVIIYNYTNDAGTHERQIHNVSLSATISPSTGRREELVHDFCVPCSYLSPDIYRDLGFPQFFFVPARKFRYSTCN